MGLVADPNMQGLRVSLGINGDSPHAEALRASGDAAGNLAAIGDQDGFEHAGPSVSPILARRRWRRLSLWTFWRNRRMRGRLFGARLGVRRTCIFFFLGFGIHDADRRDRGSRGKIIAAVDWTRRRWLSRSRRRGRNLRLLVR